MSQGPVLYLIDRDPFTRANSGNLGANWTANSDATTTGTMGIVSNTAQPSIGGNAASFYSAATFQSNQYAQCIVDYSTVGGATSYGGGPTVRGSANGYYRFFCNGNNAVNNCQVAKVVNGVFTDLTGGGFTITMATGDLLRLEANGTQLTAYHNGTIVFQTNDSSLTSGAPGVCGFIASTTNTIGLTTWEGGNLIWTPQGTLGTVIAVNHSGTSGNGNQEPTVIYFGNPQILSANPDGKIFKMWHTDGWTTANINYAESPDGVNWTEYSGNPVIGGGNVAHGFFLVYNNTYYAYISNGVIPPITGFDRYTSPDGIHWTKTNSSVLSQGAVGQWDSGNLFNPFVWVSADGIWHMYYEATQSGGSTYQIGYATSPDGIVWTKSASNPVISNLPGSVSGPEMHQFGNTYFMFTHTSPTSNLPSDVSIYSATNPAGPWTPAPQNAVVERLFANEGANNALGQLADPSVVEVNGTTYLFNDATFGQSSGEIHINLRTIPSTLLSYLTQATGVSPIFVYSQPDSRVSPNASRTVNATVTYDVQTSSNSAVPSKDSRAAGAPVVCDVLPQNSRTPGTYGPGE